MCEVDSDGETADVWTNTMHVAKRKHTKPCRVCKQAIAVGSEYMKHFQVFDGSVHTAKLCADCAKVANAFIEEHGTMPGPPDELRHHLRDCIKNAVDDPQRWRDALSEIEKRREVPR